jgi:hypothetical protein
MTTNRGQNMKHPPMNHNAAENKTDWLTYDGARELARRIQAAWRSAGYAVTPEIEKVTLAARTDTNIIYCVRTPELVNGMAPAHLRLA